MSERKRAFQQLAGVPVFLSYESGAFVNYGCCGAGRIGGAYARKGMAVCDSANIIGTLLIWGSSGMTPFLASEPPLRTPSIVTVNL